MTFLMCWKILDRSIWKFSFQAYGDGFDWTYEFRQIPGLQLDSRVVKKSGDRLKLPSRSGDDRMERKVVADETAFKGIGPRYWENFMSMTETEKFVGECPISSC